MDRVGGVMNYFALLTDASLYEDVLIVMHGEAEASQIMAAEADAKRRLAGG